MRTDKAIELLEKELARICWQNPWNQRFYKGHFKAIEHIKQEFEYFRRYKEITDTTIRFLESENERLRVGESIGCWGTHTEEEK